MTYRKRELVRKPVALIRAHGSEIDDMDFLVDYYGGVSRAEAYRLGLLELAHAKRHEANSLSARRVGQAVDKNAFSGLMTA